MLHPRGTIETFCIDAKLLISIFLAKKTLQIICRTAGKCEQNAQIEIEIKLFNAYGLHFKKAYFEYLTWKINFWLLLALGPSPMSFFAYVQDLENIGEIIV